MAQKFPTTTAYTPAGPDRANLVSAQKNFEDLFVRTKELETKVVTLEAKVASLEAKVASLEAGLAALAARVSSSSRTLSTAASVASGGSVYVAGSDSSPFVAGPTIGPSGGQQYYNPDGTPARDGYDFYWEPIPGQAGYTPVFYRDLTVVDELKTTDGVNPLDRDDRPGYYTKVYDNGHRSLEAIPLEDWNPPLAQWNNLPQDERRALTTEYMEDKGLGVMLGITTDVNTINSFESDYFRAHLESKGITGDGGGSGGGSGGGTTPTNPSDGGGGDNGA